MARKMGRRSARIERVAARRVAAGVFIYLATLAGAGTAQAQHATDALIDRANASRAKGEQGAPLRVLEIGDFQCPYCARFWREVYPQLNAAYIETGMVQWVFVNLPLPNHPHAWPAAEAALCAGGVANQFWAMHDRLYANQSEWSGAPNPVTFFTGYAEELEIPVQAFHACLMTDAVATLILKDALFAASGRISGTPAFIVGDGQIVMGVKSFEEWKELLDAALRKQWDR